MGASPLRSTATSAGLAAGFCAHCRLGLAGIHGVGRSPLASRRRAFQAVSSLSHHPTRLADTGTGWGKSPVCCIRQAVVRLMPVMSLTLRQGSSRSSRSSILPALPASDHGPPCVVCPSSAMASRPGRRRCACPHLTDLALCPDLQKVERIVGARPDMQTRRSACSRRPQPGQRRRLQPDAQSGEMAGRLGTCQKLTGAHVRKPRHDPLSSGLHCTAFVTERPAARAR